MARHAEAPERREAQRVLARAVTALVHGEEEADRAAGASQGFTRTAVASSPRASGPSWRPACRVIEPGPGAVGRDLVELLAEHGVVGSKGEGRRLVAQGGIYLNDVAITEGRVLEADDLFDGVWAMVRRGKKQRHVLRLNAG